jgi:hypothetical protein
MNQHVTAKLTLITPEMAKSFLAKNTRNRGLKISQVNALARDIAEGRWKINGDALRFAADGTMLDGQHRCFAVVKADKPVHALVVEGLESDAYDTIDIGCIRTLGDVFGQKGKARPHACAAAVSILEKFRSGNIYGPHRKLNTESDRLIESYPRIERSVEVCRNNERLMPPSILVACHYLFAEKDPQAADAFVHDVVTGAQLEEGDPVLLLRSRLVKNSVSKAKLKKEYIMALTIKAWNYRRLGDPVKTLKFAEEGGPEKFPEVK